MITDSCLTILGALKLLQFAFRRKKVSKDLSANLEKWECIDV